MRTNKEILRDYLDMSIQADMVKDVIQEVADKGRPTESYEAKLEQLRMKLEEYETNYYWIAFIVKEMDGLLEREVTVYL